MTWLRIVKGGKKMAKKFEIRNSTAEFLTFVATGKEEGIQVALQG